MKDKINLSKFREVVNKHMNYNILDWDKFYNEISSLYSGGVSDEAQPITKKERDAHGEGFDQGYKLGKLHGEESHFTPEISKKRIKEVAEKYQYYLPDFKAALKELNKQ